MAEPPQDAPSEFESSEPLLEAAPPRLALEAVWRSVVEHAPAFVGVLDLRYRMQFANRSLGPIDIRSMQGSDILELIAPEQVPRVRALLAEVVQTRQLRRTEVRGLSGNWYRASVGPIMDDGDMVGLVVIADDITELKRAEAGEHERTWLLARAEAIAHFGSWVWYFPSNRMVWSDETYRLLGYEPGSVEPTIELYKARIHPDDRASFERASAKFVCQTDDLVGERRVVLPDGQERVLKLVGKMKFDELGRPVKAIGTVRDITEERRIEHMKSEFVSVVSHELRTPLTAVRGPLQMLSRGGGGLGDAERQRLLEIALRNVERMVRLVDDIFDYNRLETGRLTLHPEPTAAADLLAMAKETCAAKAAEAEVGLEFACDAVRLVVDPQRIVQVLTNLLDNAIAFSPAGGKIRVKVTGKPGRAHFCVSDEGPGVPEAFRPVIFERFRQADPSVTRRKGGTGLGLAISRGIIEQHGGRIWLDDSAGAGATFCFELPR